MSHKSQLVKNTAIIAIGKLSTQILSYILLPLYTARMATEEYGSYDLVCTISLFLCPVITLLMEESMFRFLIDAKDEKERKKIIGQTIIYTLAGTLAFVILALLYFNIVKIYKAGFIFVFIMFVISNIVINLSNALARGLSNIKLYSFSNFVLGIATIIFNIIAVVFFRTAEGLLWANTIANIGTAIFIFAKLDLKDSIGSFDKPLMTQMVKYSLPLVPNSVSWTIINMSDRIIVTHLINAGANGIYAMANKFPNIINVLYGYFYTAWKESAAKIIKDDNKEKYYNSIYRDMKCFLIAVTICLIAAMPFAFPIFINKAYGDAYQYIPIIIIATYYSCVSSFFGGIFGAFKQTKIMGTTTFAAAVINLIIDFALIKPIGIYAACVSTLVADLIIYYYRREKLKDYIHLKDINISGPIIITAFVCFTYYLKIWFNAPSVVYWIFCTISLVIAILYSVAINKKMLKGLTQKVKEKVLRRQK